MILLDIFRKNQEQYPKDRVEETGWFADEQTAAFKCQDIFSDQQGVLYGIRTEEDPGKGHKYESKQYME